jgi:hypothetical protein
MNLKDIYTEYAELLNVPELTDEEKKRAVARVLNNEAGEKMTFDQYCVLYDVDKGSFTDLSEE